MKRFIRVLISVVLAVSLMLGTFSVGVAVETEEPATVPETVPAAELFSEGEPEDGAEGVSAEPAQEPETGDTSDDTEADGTEGQDGIEEPEAAVPELKELKLDAGSGYTIAADSAFLKEDASISSKPWKESDRNRYKDDLTDIAEAEDELLAVSVRDAAELPFNAETEVEIYISHKDWSHKSVRDLQDMGLKLYLSNENNRLKEVKTEIKKTKDGKPAVFFKTNRIADMLLTSSGEMSSDADALEETQDGGEAVDVSEHPLKVTQPSDTEPLLSLKSLSPKTLMLLDVDPGSTAETDAGEDPQSEPDTPSEADGMVIERISVKWLSKSTGSDEPAGQGTLELESDSNVIGNQQFQIDFAISGKDDHEPGSVELIFPAYLWLDRYGNEPGNLTLSVPEEPGTGADFAWRRVGDNIVITNIRRLSAASKVMIQGTFRNVKPYDMVDIDVDGSSDYADAANTGRSNPFAATIGITTPNDNYISMTSNSIDATIDTHIEAASATKSAYNTSSREYYVYHDPDKATALDKGNMPVEFLSLLDDPDEYSFARWYVSGSATGSQPFKMTVSDSYDGTVLHYKDALHEDIEELQVEGKVLGVQGALVWDETAGAYKTGNVLSSDGGQTVSATLYDGYNTLPKSAYVWTAYKKSQFPVEGDEYRIQNNQSVTVTGWDDMIETTKEADAIAPFRLPVYYKVKKVWNDEGHEDRRPDHQSMLVYYNENLRTLEKVRVTENADGEWVYTWNDEGTGRQYKVRELGMNESGTDYSYSYNSPNFMQVGNDEYSHIINRVYDDDGELQAYDRWWYELEKEEYDSANHTWIKYNKYCEEHIERDPVPFRMQRAEVGIRKTRLNYDNNNLMSTRDRGLNILRRGDDVIVDYDVYGYGYIIELTKDVDLPGTSITDFGFRDVKLELEDNYGEDTLKSAKDNTFLFDSSLRLTPDDAEVAYVQLYSPTYLQYYQPDKYSSWTFRTMTGNDFQDVDRPDEELWGLKDGEWVRYAVVHISGDGTYSTTTENDATVTGNRVVNLPSGVWKVKTVVQIPGLKDAADVSRRIDGARMEYRIGIRLRADSETLQRHIEALFDANDYAMSTLDNYATMNAFEQVHEGDPDSFAVSLDDQSRTWLHGRNHKVAVRSEKEFELVENDVVNRELKLHSKVTMTQQSNVLEANEYWDARAEGLIPSTESGIWYDLLPIGVMPDIDSIKLTSGDKRVDAYTVENYKGSGRILLVIKVETAPNVSYTYTTDPNPYKSDITYPKEGYKDVHTLEFDSYYSWDEARLYGIGDTVRNVAAFETDGTALGNINGWSGEPDDPQKNHNQRAMDAVGDDKLLMTGLDPDRTDEHTAFTYAGSVLKHEEIDFMAATELRKYVTKDGLGMWSTGRSGTTQVTVYEGGYYTYMLYVASDGETTTKNIILLDTLENYTPGTSDEDDYGHGAWQGVFDSIDVTGLREIGVDPVIYYNVSVPDLEILKGKDSAGSQTVQIDDGDYVYNYLADPANGWTTECPADKSTIKAIAVDARRKADGSDFELPPDESVYCTVRMHAKIYETTGEDTDPFDPDETRRKSAENNDYAYNNIFLGCTQVDPIGQETHAVINYNYTRVGILPFELKVSKVWDDSDNNDGKRPNSLVVHLLANGKRMNPDRTITLNSTNDWSGKFQHVIQYDEKGDWINYTFEEEPAAGQTFTLEGYRMGTEKDGENVTLTNTYTPEKVSVPVTKIWDENNSPEAEAYIPDSVTVRLLADGVFTGKTLTLKPDRLGNWAGTFKDLPKFANPSGLSGRQKEIEYSVEEAPVYRFEDSYNYNEETKTFEITNKYYPYGDLKVTKSLNNATSVSGAKEFTFTLLLKDQEGNDLTEKYKYIKTFADGSETEEGTIGNGDTFKIREGDEFTVKDIPSESTYKVIESETSGFELTGSSGTTGSIRAGTAQSASFTNTYSAEGSQLVSLKKTLDGRTMTRNQFRFELVDKTVGSADYDKAIRTISSDQNGNATFGRLSYTEGDHGKTFTYEIREINRGKPGYTYDETTYKVDVTVSDNGDGTMTCVPEYYKADGSSIQASDIKFANKYEAEGAITLRAWKQLPAGTLENVRFSFKLYEVGTDGQAVEKQTKTNDDNGTILFDELRFTEANAGKDYLYIIREVPDDDPETIYTYDDTIKGILLSVADNGDGTLAITQKNVKVEVVENGTENVTYKCGDETTDLPLFVNGLVPGNISVTKKTIWEDDEPSGGQEFRFTLTLGAPDGVELPEKITVKKSEVINAKAYSPENEPAALTPEEQQEQVLKLGEDGKYNAYEASGAQETTDVQEQEVPYENGVYEFALKAGQKLTVLNLPAGVTYQFQEEIPSGWTLTFENVSGTVVPKDEQKAVYTNRYEPGKAVATVFATKRMDGKIPEADKFAFRLIDDTEGSETCGQVLQTLPNQVSGFVLFDLEYTQPGKYHYLIQEVPKPVASVEYDENGTAIIAYSEDEDDLRKIQFDESVYGVTVEVVNTGTDENPTLSATVEYDSPDEGSPDEGSSVEEVAPPQFENTTRPGSLQISKAVEGLTEANKGDAMFTFKVTFSNDAGMPLDEGSISYYTQPSENQSSAEPIPEVPDQPENSEPASNDDAGRFAVNPRLSARQSRQLLGAPAKAPASGEDYSGGLNIQPAPGATVKHTGVVDNRDSSYGLIGGSTISWDIYTDGTLVIRPTSGDTGSFAGCSYHSSNSNWPWYSYRSEVKRVTVFGNCDLTVRTCDMFFGMSNIIEADLSGLYTDRVTDARYMLSGLSNTTKLDLSTVNLAAVTSSSSFGTFNKCSMLVIGPNTRLPSSIRIPTPPSGTTNGKWVRLQDGAVMTPEELGKLSEGGRAGTWVWGGRSYYISFNSNGGTGEMEMKTANVGTDYTIPECQFMNDTDFLGWALEPNGNVVYQDKEKIENGLSSEADKLIVLYAVWEPLENVAVIKFDANGGFTSVQRVSLHDVNESVALPNETNTSRPNYDLAGWNTAADGSGTAFEFDQNLAVNNITCTGEELGAEKGKKITLYAQWRPHEDRINVTVEHYQQPVTATADESSFTKAETIVYRLLPDTEFSVPIRDYRGFIPPEEQTITVNAERTVKYYYYRTHYKLSFNANGGTGSMADMDMIGGVSQKLPVNRFTRENYLFVGWNTQADGKGINYGDGQSVNSIAGNDETLVLYATWFDLGKVETAQPTNGEYIVTCKANETIVFPELPAGTHYTVTEVQLPDGWKLKGIDNGSGEVLSAERVNVTATNTYTATGKADIEARKFLPGETISEGQFSFQLRDEKGKIIQTKSNGGTDNMEERVDDEGNLVPNDNYGSSVVYFDSLTFNKQGVYNYTIREVVGSDTSINYDTHEEHVKVYVTDRGDGRLTAQVIYDSSGAVFRNEKGSGDLKVSKKILNATEGSKNADFSFTVYLFGSNGNELIDEYEVEKSNGEKTTVKSGGAVSIKGGESFTLKGLPHKSTYTVVESPAAGYELANSTNTEGTINGGETAEASFENAYTSRTKEADGGAVIEVKKVFENGTIEPEQFQFRLLDNEMEEIETVYAGTDGSVRFSPMHFDLNDDGARKVFYVEEIPGNDPLIVYDTHREKVAIAVSDNGDGTMKAQVEYTDRDMPVFTNVKKTSTLRLPVRKEITGQNPPKAETFAFTLKAVTAGVPMPASDTVTVSGAGRTTFGEIKYQKPGIFEYTMTETKGSAQGYTYDSSAKRIRVTVEDKGDGLVASYTIDGLNTSEVRFMNNYEPRPVTVTIPVKKIVKGSPESDSTFTFNLSAMTSGAPMPSARSIRITGSGSGTIGPITYSRAGTYTYTLSEVKGGEAGYTYDTVARRIVVTVTDNGGALTATATVNGEEVPVIEFTNVYEEPPTPPDEPSSDTPRRTTPRRTRTRSSSGEVRHHYRSARKNMILRKTADGYILIEDNGVPLAKIPTGDEIQLMIMIAVAAAAAGVIIWIALLGRRKKKESR